MSGQVVPAVRFFANLNSNKPLTASYVSRLTAVATIFSTLLAVHVPLAMGIAHFAIGSNVMPASCMILQTNGNRVLCTLTDALKSK